MGARRHRRKLLFLCRTRAGRSSRPKDRAQHFAARAAKGSGIAVILATGFIIF